MRTVLMVLPFFLLSVPAALGQSLSDRVRNLESRVTELEARLAAHEPNASAHHSRYSDPDARAAVGPHFSGRHEDLAGVGHAQHHARYADDEARTAVGPHFSGRHEDLAGVGPAQHHARYADDEARTAVGPHFSGRHEDLSGVEADQHHPPEPGAEGERPWRFVGITATKTMPGEGIQHMNAICHAEFPGSRMASTLEFHRTPNPPYSSDWLPAWIQPVLAPTADGVIDVATGLAFTIEEGSGTCEGWTQLDESHKAIRTDRVGRSYAWTCDNELAIVCSAPAAE